MDTKLQQARKYEEVYGDRILERDRPLFHVVPRVGWMNDPNGFSVYKGEYHLFYQYYPYNTIWGPMHWGHVKTKDLVRWEWLPAAIAPDEEYDNAGCFSGSAVEMPDGRQLLMYTGVKERQREDGYVESRQMQCVAFGDGIDYEKYENNPVLTSADLPEGWSAVDFRDPKIWRDEKDDCYYAVVANRTMDGSGAILLYRSADAMHWEMLSVLDRSRNEYGRMWECPDFFMMDDHAILITSPQEMLSRGRAYHNGFGNIYLIGSFDRENWKFTRKAVHAIDYGLDFYAPQTLLAPDGRRKLVRHDDPAQGAFPEERTPHPAAGQRTGELPHKRCFLYRCRCAGQDPASFCTGALCGSDRHSASLRRQTLRQIHHQGCQGYPVLYFDHLFAR